MRVYTLSMAKEIQSQTVQSQPYSDMAARKIVLILGFLMTLLGFLAMVYSSLVFFFPAANFIKSILAADLTKGLYIASLALSFVGVVFSVAGANTKKGLARLSFFFGTFGFILSAAFLVVVLFFGTLMPF